MCGLAGQIETRPAPLGVLKNTTLRMTQTLLHRGPDDGDVWVDVESGVGLGHRRLSIVDLSPEGHQPMVSADGRYVMAFNGEVYNFLSIREELEGSGHRFRGHSDTEVMLAAFLEWGIEASLRRFNSMLAAAVWDRRERKLYLMRDRIGKKPLYYGWSGSTFLFASELKALCAHPDFAASIAREVLPLYLRFGYVPAPYSIYSGIRKLLQGTFLVIDPRARGEMPEPCPYWSLREVVSRGVGQFPGSEEDALAELDALLRDSVGIRMIADVPLGAFLSGGIDSSLVVALMHQKNAGAARTFSIGFSEEAYNEAPYAKAVASHLGSCHTELLVTPAEAMAVIPDLPRIYDEPFADSSQVPTFLVSRLARREVTVALSGDGGDELFCGYDAYLKKARFLRRFGRIPPALRRTGAAALRAFSPGQWETLLGWLQPGRNVGWRLNALGHRLGYQDQEELPYLLGSLWPHPCVLGASNALRSDFTAFRQGPELDPAHLLMFKDTLLYLPDDILVKVDRASMAVSLEARCPLLDYRLLEFAWRLPLRMKRREVTGKWILRELLSRYVPRDLIDRPKQGFSIPVGQWLRGPLRDWAEDLLDAGRLRNEAFFDPAPIRRKWSRHLGGLEDASVQLWLILMFEAWLSERKGAAELSWQAIEV